MTSCNKCNFFSGITNKEDQVDDVYKHMIFREEKDHKFKHTYKLSFLNNIRQNNLEKVWGPISRTILVVFPPLRSHCYGSPKSCAFR